MSNHIDRDVINALIAGHFADPFSVLGMHRTDAGLEVRALLPDATDVWVIEPKTGRKVGKLECLDSRGFFSGVLPRRKNAFRYQLAVTWHGQQNLIDDPYRFGPLLQDLDVWLLSEGTHLRPYETLGAVTMAEESTDFAGVTRPPAGGGLGFWFKWNLGWMHDTLDYMKLDPVHRRYHHDKMTFGMLYNYTENFVLPLSHDEVVHGKKSILDRMPGDAWQKFANLRAYYGWLFAFPGKKLLFMGNEFAQGREWNHDVSLDWHLLEGGDNWHHGVQRLVRDLNHTYRHHKALHELDFDPYGFEWLVVDDHERSVFVFVRRDRAGNEIIVASNFTPVPRHDYRFGINQPGRWREALNTDSMHYHGSNQGNGGVVESDAIASHGREHSLSLTLPPLATIWLVREAQ